MMIGAPKPLKDRTEQEIHDGFTQASNHGLIARIAKNPEAKCVCGHRGTSHPKGYVGMRYRQSECEYCACRKFEAKKKAKR